MRVPESLVASLSREAERKAGDFKPQNIANTLWAVSVLDHAKLALSFFERVLQTGLSLSDATFEAQHKSQFHQFFLTLHLAGCYPAHISGLKGFASECSRSFAAQSSLGAASRLQRDVTAAIRRVLKEGWLGADVAIFEEAVVEDGGSYSVDVLFVGLPNGMRVVVEVDGPSHFLARSRIMRGSTKLKHRHLRSMGWDVVQVPYYAWDELSHRKAQDAYIRELLSKYAAASSK